MNKTMAKKIRFAFQTEAERDAALKELTGSSNYRHLIMSTRNSPSNFFLYVQTTGSLIYDIIANNSIVAIAEKHGGTVVA